MGESVPRGLSGINLAPYSGEGFELAWTKRRGDDSDFYEIDRKKIEPFPHGEPRLGAVK